MSTSLRSVPILLCYSLVAVAQKQVSYGVTYAGGSIPSMKSGASLRMFIDHDGVQLQRGSKGDTVFILAASVTEISYGQEVHRRIGAAVGVGVVTLGLGALVALSKSKKHYIGIVWNAGDGQRGGLVLQADKNEYRGLLAALEGLTGKTAVDTDRGRPSS